MKNNHGVFKRIRFYVDFAINYVYKYYTQLYTRHNIKNGIYVPLMFCLLPNKEKKDIHYITEKIEISGVTPKRVIIDFEIAKHQGIFEVFLKERFLVVDFIWAMFRYTELCSTI